MRPPTRAALLALFAGVLCAWQTSNLFQYFDPLARPAAFPHASGFRTAFMFFEFARHRDEMEAVFAPRGESLPNPCPLLDAFRPRFNLQVTFSIWNVSMVLLYFIFLRDMTVRPALDGAQDVKASSRQHPPAFPLSMLGVKISLFCCFTSLIAECIRGARAATLIRAQWPEIKPSLLSQLWILSRVKWGSVAILCWFMCIASGRFFGFRPMHPSSSGNETKKTRCQRCCRLIVWQNRQLGSLKAVIPTLYFTAASSLSLATVFPGMRFVAEPGLYSLCGACAASFAFVLNYLRQIVTGTDPDSRARERVFAGPRHKGD
jgi:hypothetical protein